jgi:hypothetical protein
MDAELVPLQVKITEFRAFVARSNDRENIARTFQELNEAIEAQRRRFALGTPERIVIHKLGQSAGEYFAAAQCRLSAP